MQQVAGFLAGISTLPDAPSMIRSAVHRFAEAVDAEVCAFVAGDDIVASVGFPAGEVPVQLVLDVARSDRRGFSAPGLGELVAVAIDLHIGAVSKVVVARSGDPLDHQDIHLLRTMARVLDLALNLRAAADRERSLRESTERQADELRHINERLAEAARVKQDLVAIASHELRTPLTSIIGFTELLLRHWEQLPDDQRRDHLTRVHRHGRRLLRLVDDLLLVGRIESGTVQPDRQRVDIAARTGDVAQDLGMVVEIRTDEGPDAFADPVHLEQILTNLLTNARKYGEPPFRVVATADSGTVVIDVSDAGEGVPPDFEERLFERFAQASTGDRRSATGTGLGLAIVAGLAAANGGGIAYRRDAGRTYFTVRLPDAAAALTSARGVDVRAR